MTKIRVQGVRKKTERYTALLVGALEAAGEPFADIHARARSLRFDAAHLRLAFAGEYAVGKSTLIAAITGLDIQTGAGVTTTQVEEYIHEELILVDMPGTLSGQAEHDAIARKAIADADLLLFVVSNELFNESSLPFFRMAAEELGKGEQMLLVVNKLDRFNLRGGTVDEAAHILAGKLAEEITPLPIEPFGPTVVSAKDYLTSLKETDPERRTRLHALSRIDALFGGINEFAEKRRLLAQHARPLQQLLQMIADATQIALKDDPERAHLEAYLRRRRHALEESRAFAHGDLSSVRTNVRQKASKPVERVLKALEKKVTGEELEIEWEQAGDAFDLVVREAGDALAQAATRWETDLRARLDEVDESPVAKRVRLDFTSPVQPGEAPAGASSLPKGVRDKILEAIGGGGGRLAGNPTVARDAVAAVYKFFGGRFRPWGKVKLGNFLGKVGKALGPLTIALQSYLDYRDENAKVEAAQQLKAFRAQVRTQFHDAVLQLDDSLREQGECVLHTLYEVPLTDIAATTQELLGAEGASKALLEQMRGLDAQVRSALAALLG